jgi:endonuclease/exonuclease/phosphatase (EEP) superfamily protein YafD
VTLDGVWFFDVLASLRVQAVIGAAALAAVALLLRRWYAGGLLAGAALVNAALMAPFYLAEPPPAMAGSKPFSMVFYNSAQNTLELLPLVGFVKDRSPDLLAFTEVHRWDIENLRQAFPDYRHTVGDPGVFGAVILSRTPIRDFQVHDHGEGPSGKTLEVTLCDRVLADRCLALIVLHPTPPLSGDFHGWRDRHILEAAALARREGEARLIDGRVVLAGDLNMTPWNRIYARSLKTGGLSDAFAGGLPHSTWFSSFAAIGLIIDHIWTGPAVGVRETEIGPLSGSDHLPIYAEFGIDVDLRW